MPEDVIEKLAIKSCLEDEEMSGEAEIPVEFVMGEFGEESCWIQKPLNE